MQIIRPDTLEKIYHWSTEACIKNDVGWLAQQLKFRFNKRLTATWGRAWRHNNLIELSALLWLSAPEEERRDPFIHDTCHIIAHHKYGLYIKHHGKEWRSCMEFAVIAPKRCGAHVRIEI